MKKGTQPLEMRLASPSFSSIEIALARCPYIICIGIGQRPLHPALIERPPGDAIGGLAALTTAMNASNRVRN
jgi:hypothetical protein